jgi:hypothetical protein
MPARTRSTAAGAALVAAGLMILGSHASSVGAAPTTAKAPVAGKVGFVSAPTPEVSLLTGSGAPGAPGETVSAQVSMTVESNKAYILTATPQAAALTSTGTADTIAATELKTVDSSGAEASFGGAVEIVRTATKSDPLGGDAHTSPLSMTIPWVEPGEYTIAIDYAVTQL